MCLIGTPVYAGVSAISDTEVESVLSSLIDPLARAGKLADGRIRLHVLSSDQFNAFVASGEDVYVYTGLVIDLKDPNEFQGVVAHEMGHMLGGHYSLMMTRMQREMAGALIMQTLGVAMMIAGGQSSQAGVGMIAGSMGVTQQNILSFSRNEERLADNAGLELLKKAGLPYSGFLNVLTKTGNDQLAMENRVNPNILSHPTTSERIRNVRDWIDHNKYDSKPLSANTVLAYSRVRAKLAGYLLGSDMVSYMYPKNDNSVAAQYARAILLMRQNEWSVAKKMTEALIEKYPNDPYFNELLGDILYQTGDYDGAIKTYKKSLALLPKSVSSYQIELALALALAGRGNTNDVAAAKESAKKVLIQNQNVPLAYWVLGVTYQLERDEGRYAWAMAEYYALKQDKKKARDYAESAVKKLPKGSAEAIKSRDILEIKTR